MRFIRKLEAAKRVGWHSSHVMRQARAGKFPKPVTLGPNSVAFVEDELEAWMQARADARATSSESANTD